MTRFLLAAGVAALAVTAPAASQPGDKGGGKDRAQSQKSERGGNARSQGNERRQASEQRSNDREQRAQRSNNREQRAQRSNGREERAQRNERRQSNERRAQAQERRGESRGQARQQRAERDDDAQRGREVRQQQARGNGGERLRERLANRSDRAQAQRGSERQNNEIQRIAERRGFQLERNGIGGERQLARLAERNVIRASDWDDLARRGVWLDGCPPGLAKKMVACVPPGQVKNLVGQPLSTLRDRITLRELPNSLRDVYSDTDDYYYRYGNGYAYRVDRSNDIVSALLPLFGLGLTTGQMFPSAYSNQYLPTSLQSFYPDSSYGSYRYANGYVYQVDQRTGLIGNVDPLLGYGYGYGQMMPATYSAYNVPYQYRSMYYDTPDNYYRYAPGAIYQVDPQTSLITAVSALLTGGMTVGQQLPTGYGAYNVPYQYRNSYNDTPDNWYRYSNGNIYQVNPTTQLVTAIVASILT